MVEEKELNLLGDLFAKLQLFYIYRHNELKIVASSHFHDADAVKMDKHDENLSSDIKEEKELYKNAMNLWFQL